MWTYSQTTGNLARDGVFKGKGYSGNGRGLNNPIAQNIHGIGPIPRGTYQIGQPHQPHTHMGILVFPLYPAESNAMAGRTGFFIKDPGDDAPLSYQNGADGIALTLALREQILASGALPHPEERDMPIPTPTPGLDPWRLIELLLDQEETLLRQQAQLVETIRQLIGQPGKPVSIVLINPKTGEVFPPMANFELLNDGSTAIPIGEANAGGVVVPIETGDTFQASNTSTLGLVSTIGLMADGVTPALILTPAAGELETGVVVTVTDTDKLKSATLTVDVVADLTPVAVVLNTAGAVFTPNAQSQAEVAKAKPEPATTAKA